MPDYLMNILGLLFSIWDFVKLAIFGLILFVLATSGVKHLILDGITDKLDDAVRHLSVIEKEAERIRNQLSDMKSAMSNIEDELKWYGDGNTLAKIIIKRLEAIESK